MEEKEKEELMSHILLRLATCLDLRLTSWFLETEGDYFAKQFSQESWPKQKAILESLFGNDSIAEVNELFTTYEAFRDILPIYTGKRRAFGIDCLKTPEMLKRRIGAIHKGWIVVDVNAATPFIKREFERKLRRKMEQLREELLAHEAKKKQALKFYEYIQKDVFEKIMKPKREPIEISEIRLDGSLSENVSKLPPCIQDLLHRVDSEGYIGHWERFQLGIFLKHIGMQVEEQLRFWYEKAVDNLGISFEEFNKKAGYIIRHIYGLEGGKIDYHMPSCKTIQEKMYCRFKHASLEKIGKDVSDLLQKMNIPEKIAMTRVVDAAQSGNYSLACGLYASILTAKGDVGNIHHPLIYLKITTEEKNENSDNK